MARREWTEEEKKYVADNGATTSIVELARALSRNIASVDSYLRRHTITRHYVNTVWCQRDVFELYRLVERYGPKVIAKKMGRSKAEITYKLRHLKLHTRTEVYSQWRAWKATGYHPYQLNRAKRALGQIWMREIFRRRKGARPKVRFTITQKQLDALCEYMKTDHLKFKRAA